MPHVSSLQAPALPAASAPARAGIGVAAPLLLAASTALSIVGVALALVLQPLYVHPALDAARAADWLGVSTSEVHRLSDRTVVELVFGPGTFAFSAGSAGAGTAPFYGRAEASHMADARTVLLLFLGLVAASVAVLAVALLRFRGEAWVWRSIKRGATVLAVAVVVVGVFALVAFDAAFELFHRLAFPQGNYTFDPRTQHLVQLYPEAFWQITAGTLAVLLVGLALLVRALAGRRPRTARAR